MLISLNLQHEHDVAAVSNTHELNTLSGSYFYYPVLSLNSGSHVSELVSEMRSLKLVSWLVWREAHKDCLMQQKLLMLIIIISSLQDA